MCEGLHETEAQLLCDAKDKKLHQVYKGLSKDVVREAFKWDENFMIEKAPVYPTVQKNKSSSNLRSHYKIMKPNMGDEHKPISQISKFQPKTAKGK